MVLIQESGDLAETSVPKLLLDLHRAGFCGSVTLHRGRTEKTLQFHDGVPVYVESNLRAESLANHLLTTGRIDQAAHTRLVERVERDGSKEGNAVLELDLLPPRAVFDALKEKVRLRLIECFGWEDGRFRVSPGDAPPQAVQAFRSDLHDLLREGVESRWSSDRLLRDLDPNMAKFVAIDPAAVPRIQRLSSDDATTAVLEAADGRSSLWQLVQRATTPRALATIWLLDAIDGLAYRDEPAAAADASADPEDDDTAPAVEIVFESEDAAAAREADAGAAARPEARDASERTSPDATALLDDISRKYEGLGEIDHYALLGIDSRADSDAIRRAYVAAAKEYHPDALTRRGFDADARTKASRVFAAIGKAYATLSRADARREYDAKLAGDDLGATPEQIATAETLYRKGEILLRQGNFRGALEFLLPAVEIYPNEAEYQSAAGWALYRQSPPKPAVAKKHLLRATEIAPDDAMAHYRLSLVLRNLEDTEAADAALSRAREIDPSVG